MVRNPVEKFTLSSLLEYVIIFINTFTLTCHMSVRFHCVLDEGESQDSQRWRKSVSSYLTWQRCKNVLGKSRALRCQFYNTIKFNFDSVCHKDIKSLIGDG